MADYYSSANGYERLLTEAVSTTTSATVPLDSLFSGLGLSLPHLDRAGALSAMSVTPEVHRRRMATFDEWQRWGRQFPHSIRPSLLTCTPPEVICFLEQWRVSRAGRARPGDPDGHLPEIAPGTLRNCAGHLSQLCLAAGRTEQGWSAANTPGNPVSHASVAAYLNGYAQHCFLNTPYVDSGAVPMELQVYVDLQEYLVAKATIAPGAFQAALLWRDACLAAYLWETGQRGKEGCQLIVTDFTYGDVRCTPAWPDLVDGSVRDGLTVLVESSNGTKSRKTKHPGTLELSTAADEEMGTGVFVNLIPPYAKAMRECGSPLLRQLFKPSNSAQDGFKDGEFKSSAYNKRLQRHLVAMGAWKGETAHSLRRGSTQLLKKLGATVSEIGEKRLWRRDTTIDLYLHPARHKSRLVLQAPAGSSPAQG